MRDLIKSVPKKCLLVLALVSLLSLGSFLSGSVSAETSETGKQKIVRRVAQNFIDAGIDLYRRGSYKQAERSLLLAQEYEKDLPVSMREKLNELLGMTQAAILEKESIPRIISANFGGLVLFIW